MDFLRRLFKVHSPSEKWTEVSKKNFVVAEGYGLRIMTEDEFIEKHYDVFGDDVFKHWNNISKGYDFIFVFDGNWYYSVEFIKSMLKEVGEI